MSTLLLPGMESEYRDLSLSQWYTPPWLAERLWSWWLRDTLLQDRKVRVVEPAAGQGALLKPALRSGRLETACAIEIDPRNIAVLQALAVTHPELIVLTYDFTQVTPTAQAYDVALMNPPYENDQDVDFILRAFAWAPQVVGIFRSALLHGVDRYESLWRHVDILRGAWCSGRPKFGKGEKSDSALSDFVALDLCKREMPRERGEPMLTLMEWW